MRLFLLALVMGWAGLLGAEESDSPSERDTDGDADATPMAMPTATLTRRPPERARASSRARPGNSPPPTSTHQSTPGRRSYADTSSQARGRDADTGWYFTTTDLTGDGQPDLVVTRAECDGENIGQDRWVVYPGDCP
jgi:hypothetical protein